MRLNTSAYVKRVMHGHTTTARHMSPVMTSAWAHVVASMASRPTERCVCYRVVRIHIKSAANAIEVAEPNCQYYTRKIEKVLKDVIRSLSLQMLVVSFTELPKTDFLLDIELEASIISLISDIRRVLGNFTFPLELNDLVEVLDMDITTGDEYHI